jgi:hypothetical protein
VALRGGQAAAPAPGIPVAELLFVSPNVCGV